MLETLISGTQYAYTFKFRKNSARFEELWSMISTTRHTVKQWLLAATVVSSTAENCANAHSELLENCIRYAAEGSNVQMTLSMHGSDIVVETLNITDAMHYANLYKAITVLRTAPDLQQMFVWQLQQSLTGTSYVGLSRIVLETSGFFELVPHNQPNVAHVKFCMHTQAFSND